MRLALVLVSACVSLSSGAAVKPSPATVAPGTPALQTPEERMAMLWEDEAMRRDGRFICTNPNHHHKFSPQMMLLREDRIEDGFDGGK